MTARTCLAVLAAVFSILAPAAADDQYPERKAPTSGFTELAGEFDVQPPLNIAGPFPYLVRKAREGDLVLVQIRYPVSPPMPGAVAISTEHQRVELLGTAHTAAEVALLSREARLGGGFGVGFVQLVFRAKGAGTEQVTVHLKLVDGSTKNVPLAFEIAEASK